ncbi:4Fe-4S binding protein [Desulfovirgula thermocuniculi]|uniref:4Fe-4S binding protein n=1 Tax=Desulfovirgula thermocuniculi TaxID=348842 RepID=UPI000480C01D|nr:4Fe-4S binding protein [Desulfovirgula thermocuniculi]
MGKKGRLPRTQFRVAALSFVVTVLLFWQLKYPLRDGSAVLVWLTRLDPLLWLGRAAREGSFPSWSWLPLAVVLATLLAGRVFCGWLCPVGGMLAILEKAKLGFKRPAARVPLLEALRYPWLALLLALWLAGSGWPLLLTPYALLGHELARIWSGRVPYLLLVLLAVGIIFFPRFWCVYLCPSGLFFSLLGAVRLWRFTAGGACTGCGACAKVCPSLSREPCPGGSGSQCLVCGRCREACPVGAVSWAGPGGAPREEYGLRGSPQTRRQFLAAAGAAVLGLALGELLARPAAGEVLRPPGALPEEEFLAACARCGRCIKVCPTGALEPLPLAFGPAAFETPRLVPRKGRCELCLLCQEVCPTGAIARVPLEEVKIGTAELDRRRCLVWGEGVLCLLCAEQCPMGAIALDGLGRPVVLVERCVGCGACENGCPVEGAAIHVRRRAGEGAAARGRQRYGWPRHRYRGGER